MSSLASNLGQSYTFLSNKSLCDYLYMYIHMCRVRVPHSVVVSKYSCVCALHSLKCMCYVNRMHACLFAPPADSQHSASRGTLLSWKLTLYGSNLSRHDIDERRRCGVGSRCGGGWGVGRVCGCVLPCMLSRVPAGW